MEAQVLFSGVPVADFDRAVEWYGTLFGRAPDVVAHETEVMWRVTDGGWVYVVLDAARAGRALVSIAVPDLDAALEELRGRGVDIPTIEQVGEAGRKATLLDPEGNTVSLLEVT